MSNKNTTILVQKFFKRSRTVGWRKTVTEVVYCFSPEWAHVHMDTVWYAFYALNEIFFSL